MENRVETSEIDESFENLISACPPQSRAGKGVIVSEGDERVEKGEGLGFKRRRTFSLSSAWGTNGHLRKRRRARKEAPLSSFEPFVKVSGKVVGNYASSSCVHSSALEPRLNGFASDQDGVKSAEGSEQGKSRKLNGSVDISHALDDDNGIVIPRRPRGFSGRKKLETNEISKTAVKSRSRNLTSVSASSRKGSEGVRVGKLSSYKKKKRKIINEIKERDDSTKEVDLLVRHRDKDNGPSQNGGTLVSKMVQKRRRKRPVVGKQKQDSVAKSPTRAVEDFQGEEEENLEENAARMLSSRFDPSFTRYHSKNRETTSHSANGSHFSSLYGRKTENRVQGNRGMAGRVLRPIRRHRLKGLTRKRRHFYELNASNFNPILAVNCKIKVFWPLDQSWYFGLVKEYNPLTKLHHVKYDDRDEEWINLQNERFKLLLLPSEKSDYGGELRPENRHANANGNNCSGGFMDSEPIISWLAQSSHLVKSSSVGISGKRSMSNPGKNVPDAVLSDSSCGTQNGRSDLTLSKKNKIGLSGGLPSGGGITEKSGIACVDTGNVPLVYSRRRSRKNGQKLRVLTEETLQLKSLDQSIIYHDSVGIKEDFDLGSEISDEKGSSLLEYRASGWHGESFSFLKLFMSPLKLGEVTLKFSKQLSQLLGLFIGGRSFLPRSTLLLFQHGPVIPLWPNIHLEMLFVDSVEGVRFFLFEGCLIKAVAVVCLILSMFCHHNAHGKLANLNLPVTSIRFKLSDFQALGKQFVFICYNYLELNSLKWLRLDDKLRQQCKVTKELSLSECTYSNFETIQSVKGQCSRSSLSKGNVFPEVAQGLLRYVSSQWDSSYNCAKKVGSSPAYILSFSAAPTFFLNLHLKLLMENNVSSFNIQNHNLAAAVSLPCEETPSAAKSHSKVETDVPLDDDGLVNPSQKSSLDSEVNAAETSVGQQSLRKNERCSSPAVPTQFAESCFTLQDGQASLDKCDTQSPPFYSNRISLQGSRLSQVDALPLDREIPVEPSASHLVCSIPASNPTGPRSLWSRTSSNLSSPLGDQFGFLSDGRTDFMCNSFSNGSRKPRTQVSYSLPFSTYEGSKHKSTQRRGRPYKRIKTDALSGTSGDPSQRHLDASSCDANILVILGDRGWRESGAKVVLEFVDHKDWLLLVKHSGVTKYSYKAHQFLQPGTANRYTHAMMWKGGKDWILEFSDRSQWNRFKEIHDECYNQNIQAASVKNIPIPGVRLIEDSDDNLLEVPFVRSSLKYYRQVGTEVDVALDPSCVVYDMDSDDENWLKSLDTEGNKLSEISEELFEKVMDMFEKFAYRQQCSEFALDEIEHAMVGVAPFDVVKAIYPHWLRKRATKGMPSIRQFQPALWELYQKQLKEWELALSKLPGSNSCNGKVPPKPPMFAFCLRPCGLELPNKGSKHRSHKKFSVAGHYNAFLRDNDSQHVVGRRLNGFSNGEEKSVGVYLNHDSDYSPRHQTSRKFFSRSASDAGVPMSSWESDKYFNPRFQHTRLKKMGLYVTRSDHPVTGHMINNHRYPGSRNWNMGHLEWSTVKKQYLKDGFPLQRSNQIGGVDYDEFRLRDASRAAQHAASMAKFKRERAQRLLHRAEVAVHKAVVALVTAEAIKASEEASKAFEGELNSDG